MFGTEVHSSCTDGRFGTAGPRRAHCVVKVRRSTACVHRRCVPDPRLPLAQGEPRRVPLRVVRWGALSQPA